MNFAMSFPAIEGGVVMQGHADYCAANGHAKHTILGANGEVLEVAPYCPRCGDNLKPTVKHTRTELIKAAIAGCYEIHSKSDGTVRVEFASPREAALASAKLEGAGCTEVEICPNPKWVAYRVV